MEQYKYQPEYDIFVEAEAAAKIACHEMIKSNPDQWFPCGFSWVKIKPARGKFVSMLKDRKIGHTDDFEGGYVIYNPSRNSTQWMDAKIAGSKAFVEVLRKHGINAKVESRID